MTHRPSIYILNDHADWESVAGPFEAPDGGDGWEAACDFLKTMERIPGYRYKIE